MREPIYKDEAYKAIDNCIRDGWGRISPSEAKMNIHHLVSDANEADRPQGEWIPSDSFDEWYGRTCECSVCGNEFLRFNFCPNCGARMKGAS